MELSTKQPDYLKKKPVHSVSAAVLPAAGSLPGSQRFSGTLEKESSCYKTTRSKWTYNGLLGGSRTNFDISIESLKQPRPLVAAQQMRYPSIRKKLT